MKKLLKQLLEQTDKKLHRLHRLKFATKKTTKQYLFTITGAAKFLGVSADTLRNWEEKGELIPQRTKGGARRYRLEELQKALVRKNPQFLARVPEYAKVITTPPTGFMLKLLKSPKLLILLLIASLALIFLTGAFTLRENRKQVLGVKTSSNPIWDLINLFIPQKTPQIVIKQETNKQKISELESGLAGQASKSAGLAQQIAALDTNIYKDLIGKTIIDSYGNVYPAGGVTASLGTLDRKYTGLYLNSFTVDTSGNLKVYGQTTLGDSSSDTIKLVGRLSNDIIPATTNEISLGDGDRYFKKGYINQITYDTGSGNSWTAGTLTATGNLGVGASASITGLIVANGGIVLPSGVNLTFSSFTQGSALFAGASGVLSQSAANFYWDNTNYRLGIGTSNPVSALQVMGNVGIGATTSSNKLDVWGNSRITGSLTVDSTANLSGDLAVNGNTTLGNSTSDTITFTGRVNSSLLPAATGNVDLGSSDLKWNNLYSNTITTASIQTSGQGIFNLIPASSAIADGSVYINPTTATAARPLLSLAIGGVEKARITTDGYLGLGGANDPGSTYLINGGSLFNVGTSGNVGIGTTSPGAVLGVIGNVGIGTSGAGAALQVNGGGLFGWGTASVASPSNGLAVFGNVGIGTTTADYNLSVIGTANFTGNVGVGSSLTVTGLGVLNGGIQTTNINVSTLTVSGAADLDGDVSIADTNISFDGASTTFTTTGAFTLTPGGAVLLGDGGDTMQINTSDWDISTDGNLSGIGTIAADGLLTLSANNAALSFTGTTPSLTSGSSVFGLFAGGNVGIGTTGNVYGGLTVRGAGTGTNITLQTYGSNLTQGLTVLDNGNVGIGTTNPLSELFILKPSGTSDVHATTDGLIVRDGGYSDGKNFEVQNSAGGSQFIVADGGNVGIGIASLTNKFQVTGGNVGIGVTTAISTLAVNGNSTIGWGLTGVAGPANGLGILGNVGIGTTTADYNLSVIGTANFTGNVGIGSSLTVTSAGIFGSIQDNGSLVVNGTSYLQGVNASTLTTTGNVGVGASLTTTGLTLANGGLQVTGLSNLTGNVGIGGTATFNNPAIFNGLTNTGSVSTTSFLAGNGTASQPSYSFTNLTNAGLWTNGDGLLLTTGGSNTSGITVTGAGNIGIGVTSPSATLHILSTSTQSTGILLERDGQPIFQTDGYGTGSVPIFISRQARGTRASPTASYADDALLFFGARGYGATGFAAGSRATLGMFASEDWTDSAQGAYITFGTTPNGSTTRVERVRINNSGNVGIGTINPESALTVIGNIGIGTSNAGAALQANGGGLFGWGTASVNLASGAIAGFNGNVGVGTTSPLANLHVVGQCVAEGTRIRRRRRKNTPDGGDEEDSSGVDWEDIPVEDIKPGDEVLSLNDKTGKWPASNAPRSDAGWEWRKVEATLDKGIQTVYRLETESGKWIETTSEHPYLVRQQKTRLSASFLTGLQTNVATPDLSIRILPQTDRFVNSSVDLTGVAPAQPDLTDPERHWSRPTPITLSHKWIKVSRLKQGMEIATTDGFEKIVSIKKIGRVKTYDLQIEGTHNFVGNDIVAHNTFINNGLNIGSTFTVSGVAVPTNGLAVSGNVGIGTTTPRLPLEVWGNGTNTATFLNGNVGIGTTAPSYQMEVSNSTNSTLHIAADSDNVGGDIGTENAVLRFSTDANGWWSEIRQINLSGDMRLDTVISPISTPVMSINGSGNIGIGFTSPNALLHIGGANNTTAAYGLQMGSDITLYRSASNTLKTDNNLVVAGTLGVTGATTLSSTAAISGALTMSANNAALSFTGTTPSLTSGSSVFGLFAGGNVGIGTTGNVYGGLTVRGAGTGTNITLQTYGSNLTQGLTVLDNGNVGIGTTNPSRLLSISAATTPFIDVNFTTNTSYTRIQLSESSTANGFLQSIGSNFVTANRRNNVDLGNLSATGATTFWTNSTERMRIDSSGNVGIGTSGAGAALQVNGGGLFGWGTASVASPANGLGVFGNVGIGTTTADYNLSVIGTANFTGNVGVGSSLTVTGLGILNGGLSTTSIQASSLVTSGNIGVGGSITGFGTLSGLNVTGLSNLSSLNVTGISTLTGNVGIGSSLTVTSAGIFGSIQDNGSLVVNGTSYLQALNTTSINASTLTTTGNVGVGGSITGFGALNGLNVTGLTNLAGLNATTLTTTGNIGIGGTATFNNPAIFNGITNTGNFSTTGQFLGGNGSATNPSYSFSNLTNAGLWTNGDGLLLTTGGSNTSGITVTGSGNIGIGTSAPGAQLEIASSATSAKTLILKNKASQTVSNFEAQSSTGTPYVTIGPDVLAGDGTQNFLNVTGTLPTTLTGEMNAINASITTAGSSNQPISGLKLSLLAGYTGSNSTLGLNISNAAAGTGNTFVSGALNAAIFAQTTATTTGTNMGAKFSASGGNLNTGVLGRAIGAKDSATNIGVVGAGNNTGTSSYQMGGFFTLDNGNGSAPAVSGGLVASNYTTTSPIFLALDNATEVFRIADGGNVGIGTTNPAQIFAVGTGATSNFTVTSAGALVSQSTGSFASTLSIANGSATTPALNFTNSTGIGLWSPASNILALTSGTPSDTTIKGLSVNANGSVGIGTSNPSYPLHVFGNTSDFVLALDNYNAAPSAGIVMRAARGTANAPTALQSDDVLGTINFRGYATTGFSLGRAIITAQASETWTDSAQGTYLTFQTTATGGTNRGERMRIDPSGNIGIGTALPTAIFQVNPTGGTTPFVVTSAGFVGIGRTNPGSALTVIGNVGIGTSAAGAALQVNGGGLFGWGTASVASPANGLGVSGNVGIGTTTADYNLSVIGTANFTGNVGVGSSLTVTGLGVLNGGLSTTSIQASSLTTSGNITSNGVFLAPNGSASAPAYAFSQDNGVGLWKPGTGIIALTTGAPAAGQTIKGLSVDSNGNVGIGTTNPGMGDGGSPRYLHIEGVGTNAYGDLALTTNQTANGGVGGRITFGSTGLSGSDKRYGMIDMIKGDALTVNPIASMRFFTSNGSSGPVERMRIDSTGNIGIGTASPVGRLHLLGSSTSTAPTFMTQNSTSTNFGLAVLDNGNVGIGTTSPNLRLGAKLDIAASANYSGANISTWSSTAAHGSFLDLSRSRSDTIGTQTVVQNGDSLGYLVFRGSGGTTFQDAAGIRAHVDGTPGSADMPGRLSFWTTPDNAVVSLERMRIDSTGNIGIGLTSPLTKLGVAGNVGIGISYSWLSAPVDGLIVQGNTGIGTSAPQGVLDVNGTSFFRGVLTTTGNIGIGGTATFSSLLNANGILNSNGSATTPSYSFTNLTNAGLWTNGDGLLLTTGGSNTSGITVTGSGNVGIGTTIPSELVHLRKDQDASTLLRIDNTSSGTSALSGLTIRNGALGATEAFSFLLTGTGYTATTGWQDSGILRTPADISGGIRLSAGAGGIHFEVGGINNTYEKVTIDNGGNVGIGFTSPDRSLQLAYDININPTVASMLGAISATNGTQFSITGNTGTGTQQKLVLGIDNTNNFGVIQAGNTSGTAYDLALNPAGGNVGIGVTTTTGVLTVGSSSITSGKLVDLNTYNFNTLNTGTLLNISSAATSLTGTAGTGSLLNLSWAPPTSTTATGDLFALNIGANGLTTGNLFNILDNSSSIFSISQTALTTTIPASFQAVGDVGVAYDLNFTNTTASFIKSSASLSIIAGEIFDSQNLTLATYNGGNLILAPNTGNLWADGTNVGIGTTNPITTFQVGPSFALAGKTLSFSTVTGNLGIGTTSPGATLSVAGNLGIGVSFANASIPSNGLAVQGNVGIGTTSTGLALDVVGSARFSAVGSGAQANDLRITSDGTLTTNTSDITLKTNLVPFANALDKIKELKTYSFNWLNDPNGRRDIGLIAQDVATVIPEITFVNKSDGKMGVNYSRLGPILISALQELDQKIDGTGNLSIGTVKMDKLILSASEATSSALTSDGISISYNDKNNNLATVLTTNSKAYLDLENRVKSQESRVMGLEEKIASLSAQVASSSATIATPSASIASDSAALTDPTVLFATQSATIKNLAVQSDATISGQLTAYSGSIQDTFKSLGKSFMGETNIAGDLTVDGTMSISGNSLSTLGILSLQNGVLAGNVDMFNGLFVFDKNGDLTVSGKVLAEQFSVKKDKSSGVGKILAGNTKVTIPNNFIDQNSLIFVTPHAPLLQTMAVTKKGTNSFTVSLINPETADVEFDYLIVGQE